MQPGNNISSTTAELWSVALSPNYAYKAKPRIKKSEIVHYPEFEEASKSVEDDFWKEIFRSCARKKFPRGFLYTPRLLKHRTSGNSIVLPDDTPSLIMVAMNFFQENGRIYSEKDSETRYREEEEPILQQLANRLLDWTSIAHSKTRRSIYVRDYVQRKYADRTPAERDEIYTQINVGFETRYLTKDHVVFEHGKIQEIQGIDLNPAGPPYCCYSRPLPNRRLTYIDRPAATKSKVYRHYENWVKYLNDRKKKNSSSKSCSIPSEIEEA